MPDAMNMVLTTAVAFLLGSVPTGYLVARAKGVDIRQHGSGNIGATNVFRTVGKPLGVLVFLLDALKGFAAVWLAAQWGGRCDWAGIAAAVAAIAGHNYTPWLGFKGGKGIATSAGVLIALMPWAVLAIAVVWFAVFFASRYVSLASLCASAALPVAVAALWFYGCGGNAPLLGFSALIAALAIWRHRSNIQRLMAGTEHRFDRKTSPQ
ncbi:MAG: glycerol-3-phosphate 1-O-acyltransferase PlsY [Chthoniobacterales bacterium]|jgi:glycerol-3-phosphate acyltransferase PlsY